MPYCLQYDSICLHANLRLDYQVGYSGD